MLTTDAIARDLAERLAAGPGRHLELLGPLWGDEVEVLHDPAMPTDGTFPGVEIARRERAAFERMQQAIPDLRHESVATAADGEFVQVGYDLTGTFPDGQVRRARVNLRFTIRDGRILGYLGQTDLAAIEPFARVADPAYDWSKH